MEITASVIKDFRKSLKLTQADFAKKIGVTRDTIINYERGETIPETKVILLRQLIYSHDKTKQSQNDEEEIYINKSGNKFFKIDGEIVIEVPLLYFEAYARYLDELNEAKAFNAERTVSFVIDKLDTVSTYLAFRIVGDSMAGGKMEDTPHKAVVLGKEIQKTDWLDGGLKENSQYGWIILTDRNILFKDIIGIDKSKAIVTCHSRNNSPEYADFDLSLNEVHRIFKVIKRTF